MNSIELTVAWIIGVVLLLAALLTLARIIRGPSVLDRVVASDVMVSIIVSVLAVEAAFTDHSTTLPILISLSLIGFIGSVAVARFVARDRDAPSPDQTTRRWRR
ncbi:monovalent cation/H+ antiporter complex subunit F [Demetria terragena]|uniref:monovalent cation/H+ antiporter complex subunit F n=1 Tax=Demetria terragena TaxID=63959 RepID=UPI00035DFA1A|nr:monovalent cation/H+ antiporter complex subunit F [Demetria terragena]